MNAFGNGLVVPFLLIYLHNERGIGLGVAGLILATNAGVSLVAGPVVRRLRRPRRRQDDADDRAWLPHARLRRVCVRREPVARLRRERRDRDRQRRLLAGAVDAARRSHDARPALGDVRDAASGDEPRHRPRRRRRRLHRDGELPRALPAGCAHLRRLRSCADRLRARAHPQGGARRALRQLPHRLPPQGLHGAAGPQRALHQCRDCTARDPAGVRQERGRRHRARHRLALLHQHGRRRGAAATDDPPPRGSAARALPRPHRRRLRRRLAARARQRPLALGRRGIRVDRPRGRGVRSRRVPSRRRAAQRSWSISPIRA